MMKRLMLILLTAFFSNLSESQRIDVKLLTANFQQLTPAQFDFKNFQSTVWLFTITITTDGIDTVKIVNGKIKVKLDDGTIVENVLEDPGFESAPFVVNQTRALTNFDFGKGPTKIELLNYKVSNIGRTKIIEPALSTGRFPAGEYTISINVINVNLPTGSGWGAGTLELENPIQIELHSPRDYEKVTEFPLFEWTYNAKNVEIIINERYPSYSKEEAIVKFPFVYRETFTDGRNSFQYPTSGVRPLKKGKSYVWMLVGKVFEAGGEKSYPSVINEFKVASDFTHETVSDLLEKLEKALGNKWHKVFEKIKDEKLNPTDKIYLNGKSISDTELNEIIEFLKHNQNNIKTVTLE